MSLRGRRLALAVILLVAVAGATTAVIAALDGREHGSSRRTRVIDAVLGSFRGVTLRDSEAEVRGALGKPEEVNHGGPITPAREDFVEIGGPTVIRTPGARGERALPLTLRYDDMAVLVWDDEVFGIVVTDGSAETRRGVGVGDPLSVARHAYSDLHCGDAVAGEALLGRTPTYPFCSGRIAARRWVWFGRDPIRSIVVATTPMSG